MKIIKLDGFFSNLTVDSTKITADSSITVDTIQYYDDAFRITIVPRKYDNQLTLKIREPYTNEIVTIELDYTFLRYINGLLHIKLESFMPINDARYYCEVFDSLGEEIWAGQVMYTAKEIQNYQVNNSDENNLKI